MRREWPGALLARRTRTMKLCSSDARSRGQPWPLPWRELTRIRRSSLNARSEKQSSRPAEEGIRKNDRTKRSVNAPGGIAQFGKVEYLGLFLLRRSMSLRCLSLCVSAEATACSFSRMSETTDASRTGILNNFASTASLATSEYAGPSFCGVRSLGVIKLFQRHLQSRLCERIGGVTVHV